MLPLCILSSNTTQQRITKGKCFGCESKLRLVSMEGQRQNCQLFTALEFERNWKAGKLAQRRRGSGDEVIRECQLQVLPHGLEKA